MLIIGAMSESFSSITMMQISPVGHCLLLRPRRSGRLSLFIVKKGDRIAQLICEKIEMANLIEEEVRIYSFPFLP